MSLDRLLSELSLKSIQQSIEFVKGADLRASGIDELRAALDPMLRAYGCFAMRIGRGEFLYRAMKHNPGEKCFHNVNRIYPAAQFLKTLGRASREAQPIFYLSGDPVVALHEVRAAAGDTVSILACQPRGVGPLLVPMGIETLMNKRGVKAGGDFPKPSDRVRKLLNNDLQNLRKYEVISRFLTEEFLKDVANEDEHEYKTTIAIAETLLRFDAGPGGPIGGLAYPSLAALWTHANVALLPKSFLHNYTPVQCQQITIEKLLPDLGFRHYEEVAASSKRIAGDGTIEWERS